MHDLNLTPLNLAAVTGAQLLKLNQDIGQTLENRAVAIAETAFGTAMHVLESKGVECEDLIQEPVVLRRES